MASVAIGPAFTDIFENFFAGVILLWKFPLEPGDFIERGEITTGVAYGEDVEEAIDVLYRAKSAPLDQRKSRSEVIIALKSALDKAGIKIPFPDRKMTFAEPLRIESSEKSLS